MAEIIKAPAPGNGAGGGRIQRDVSEMLLRIERRGETAVREYSRVLDDWSPPEFLLTLDELAAAAGALPVELREHIAFSQEQVRAFAAAQRATLSDVELAPLPGVVLGHRHLPIGRVGAYVPGGRYPMFASSFMTVLVAKTAGVGHVVASTPPHRGHIPPPAPLAAACHAQD